MQIMAIWSREKVAPKDGMIFALTSDGRFLSIEAEEEYIGKDAGDNRLYKDTGNIDIYNAFEEKFNGKAWTFETADYMIRYFGGELIRRF